MIEVYECDTVHANVDLMSSVLYLTRYKTKFRSIRWPQGCLSVKTSLSWSENVRI